MMWNIEPAFAQSTVTLATTRTRCKTLGDRVFPAAAACVGPSGIMSLPLLFTFLFLLCVIMVSARSHLRVKHNKGYNTKLSQLLLPYRSILLPLLLIVRCIYPSYLLSAPIHAKIRVQITKIVLA